MRPMNVLIVTRSDDNECIERVMLALEVRGASAYRFDTDLFPTRIQIAMQYNDGAERLTAVIDNQRIDLRDISAVWYRRVKFAAELPSSLQPQIKNAAFGESRATVFGMLASMRTFWLDPQPIIRFSGNKQLQLQIARELDLPIPKTLITNEPAAVREFFEQCPGGVVTKMLSSFAVLDDAGAEQVVFTTPVKREHLADLDGLRFSPMVFQEQVAKKLELRITVVGEQVFAASIDSQATDRAKVDWRREGSDLVEHWRHYDLPDDVRRKLLQMMDRLRLNYGAIDVIVTPEGQHVFLEVNPAGEFFWLELHPGFPISEAIADVLLGRATRRQHGLPTCEPRA